MADFRETVAPPDAGGLPALVKIARLLLAGGIDLPVTAIMGADENTLEITVGGEAKVLVTGLDDVQATLDAVLAAVDGLEGKDYATEAKLELVRSLLAQVLAKIIATPATEAKQDTQITRLAEIRDKLIVAPATEATLLDVLASIDAVFGAVDGIEAQLALIKAKTDNLDVALSTRAVTGLTDTELRASAVPVSIASAPLPVGAATEAGLDDILAAVSALALLVDSLESLVGAQATLVQTQPVSMAATPTGAATATKQDDAKAVLDNILLAVDTLESLLTAQALYLDGLETLTGAVTEAAPSNDTNSSGLNGRLQRIAQRLTTLLAVFPATLDTDSGNKSASTLRFVLATDQPNLTTPLNVKETKAATPTQSSIPNSATNVTLLAANANRLGATIFNDDTAGTGATLKVKLGATASASSFTVAIAPQGYYEVPFGYTGIIDGIASAATGNARITELAA